MRLVWSNISKQEMLELRAYSLKIWGRDVAVKYMSDIRDCAKLIARGPHVGRRLKGDFRIIRVRSHYLIFKINEATKTAVIARVIHVTMDIERHLPSQNADFKGPNF